MLPDIIDIVGSRVGVIEARKASVRHVFLILRPRDTAGFENINDGGDLRRNGMEGVVANSKVVSADDRNIIGLRRMGYYLLSDPTCGRRPA